MLSEIYHYYLVLLHILAPFAIITLIPMLIWMLIMGRKWKKEDPERWYS